MDRIAQTFARCKAEGRPAFVSYVCAGDPDVATSKAVLLALAARPAPSAESRWDARLARLDFRAPDEIRFPALRLAREAMQAGAIGAAIWGAYRHERLAAAGAK